MKKTKPKRIKARRMWARTQSIKEIDARKLLVCRISKFPEQDSPVAVIDCSDEGIDTMIRNLSIIMLDELSPEGHDPEEWGMANRIVGKQLEALDIITKRKAKK